MMGETASTTNSAATAETPCWSRIGIDGDGSCPELKAAIHCRNCHIFTESGRGLLDRPLVDEYRTDWTQRLAAEVVMRKRATHSVLIFSIQSEYLALPTGIFNEVAEPRQIRRVPGTLNKLLLGLVNIRGELQLCISMRALLGFEGAETAADSSASMTATGVSGRRILLMQRSGEAWAFPVDEVHGVHRYNIESLSALPATVEQSASRFSKGTLEWHGKNVGRLDDAAIFDALKGSMT